jgi:hypothetical protein
VVDEKIIRLSKTVAIIFTNTKKARTYKGPSVIALTNITHSKQDGRNTYAPNPRRHVSDGSDGLHPKRNQSDSIASPWSPIHLYTTG